MIGRIVLALILVTAVLAVPAWNNTRDETLQGWVEADLVFISPDDGGRVENLVANEGATVERGALLFELDDELQRADLAVAEATVTNAKAAFQRAEQLLKANAGTQKSYDDAEAALRTARARRNQAQIRLARRRVVSPTAGTVHQIYFRRGEIVPIGRPVVALLPPGNIKLRFFVPQALLPHLSLGTTVGVRCDGCEAEQSARISFISRSAEYTPPVIYSREERTKLVFMAEARPDDPEKLRVGQPVSIVLPPAAGVPP
jgi:HlyD family secretion protein